MYMNYKILFTPVLLLILYGCTQVAPIDLPQEVSTWVQLDSTDRENYLYYWNLRERDKMDIEPNSFALYVEKKSSESLFDYGPNVHDLIDFNANHFFIFKSSENLYSNIAQRVDEIKKLKKQHDLHKCIIEYVDTTRNYLFINCTPPDMSMFHIYYVDNNGRSYGGTASFVNDTLDNKLKVIDFMEHLTQK